MGFSTSWFQFFIKTVEFLATITTFHTRKPVFRTKQQRKVKPSFHTKKTCYNEARYGHGVPRLQHFERRKGPGQGAPSSRVCGHGIPTHGHCVPTHGHGVPTLKRGQPTPACEQTGPKKRAHLLCQLRNLFSTKLLSLVARMARAKQALAWLQTKFPCGKPLWVWNLQKFLHDICQNGS